MQEYIRVVKEMEAARRRDDHATVDRLKVEADRLFELLTDTEMAEILERMDDLF